ncbi:MAG TPA: hypothetical protein VGG64_17335 [Pirellulales bacterium]
MDILPSEEIILPRGVLECFPSAPPTATPAWLILEGVRRWWLGLLDQLAEDWRQTYRDTHDCCTHPPRLIFVDHSRRSVECRQCGRWIEYQHLADVATGSAWPFANDWFERDPMIPELLEKHGRPKSDRTTFVAWRPCKACLAKGVYR